MKHWRWCVYYEDGTTFTDLDGEPWESPRWGAVAVAQRAMPVFRDKLIDGPVFLYREDWGCWMETEDKDDQLSEYCNVISAYRKGRYMRNDKFREIWERVNEDAKAFASA